ncbi:MAG: response regulator [Alphaproteobacteria bacterium]|nr:response regulator [Rhodospirillales bacterium]MCW9045587.1 response regulator [Alphaproteobacteria bacterium]
MGKILVVDDEPELCSLVRRCLEPGGFSVSTALTGKDMLKEMGQDTYDLVILDLNLQGEDGLTYLKELRKDQQQVPVIILTARGEPIERVVGLELGADDYVSKPFEPRELLARVRTVLRRAKPTDQPQELNKQKKLVFEGWELDMNSRELTTPSGEKVKLTTAQFDILAVLVTHPNEPLNRDQILDLARNRMGTPFDRSIDVHVGHLRKKFQIDSQSQEFIKTVHGIGYLFSADVKPG